MILVNKYKSAADEKGKNKIYKIYIKHFKYINNWYLVDVTCSHIVGVQLMGRNREVLYKWARSNHLWIKRIAIISNWRFIRNGDLNDVFKISEILLKDEHDLIHKAVGWRLREAGKKNIKALDAFFKKTLQIHAENYVTLFY